MLYLIAASILTLTTLADLETVTEEWVAPGVDITKETLVEFADHGEMFQGASEPYVGCHVTFVEVEGQEKWRAVVVYADRVVLFQEDREPVVTLHDFPVDNCSFSESGNYVVLHDGGEVDTDRNGLRINAETRERVFFDAQPEGMLDKSDFWIWEDGSLAFIRTLNWDAHIYRFFFLDSTLSESNSFDAMRPCNGTQTDSLFIFCHADGLACFNRQGELLWEQPLEHGSLGKPAIANDEILLHATSLELELRSCVNGEVIRTYPFPENTRGGNAVFFPNGHNWLCQIITVGSKYGDQPILSGSIDTDMVETSPDQYPNASSTISYVSSSHLLVNLRHRHDSALLTYATTDHQYNPIFAHTLATFGSLHPFLQGNGTDCKLSDSGFNLLYSSASEINVAKIGE